MKIFILTIYLLVVSFVLFSFQKKPSKEIMERGEIIYMDFCVQCHGVDGKGVEKIYPPLAQSDFLKENITQSIAAIKYGMEGEIVVNNKKYNGIMASQGLENSEIADVMNYILNSWDNYSDKIITEEEVDKVNEK